MNARCSRWLAAGLLSVLTLPLLAEPMPVESVVAAARGWLKLNRPAFAETTPGPALDFLAPIPADDGTILFYVASLDQGGTMVMAPDNAIEPVIAFSERSLDLADPDPCNHLRWMLENDLADRLADVREKAVKNATAKADKWAWLMAVSRTKGGVAAITDVRVAPLTVTRWSQSYVYQGSTKLAVYNYFTPNFTAGNAQNYYCGCVATALAQIMRYHKYPKTGVGTSLYGIEINGASRTRALKGGNGTGGAYAWADMPADPAALAKSKDLTTAQRMAIGYLCHDAGVASHMSYWSSGSSAPLCWSAGHHPLEVAFNYASVESPWVAAGTTFPKASLNKALNPSLDAGLPCALAIRDYSGYGHAIVVDGYGYYASTIFHHLNLGWGGSETAWYNLPSVGTSVRSYSRVDGMVFNIHPTKAAFAIISGRVTDGAGNPVNGVQVIAKHTGDVFPNKSGFTNAKGIYALLVPFGEFKVVPVSAGHAFLPANRVVTVGAAVTRNSNQNTFKRVAP